MFSIFGVFYIDKNTSSVFSPIWRTVHETGESFGDAQHIFYVNGEYQKDDPIGRLMKDFFCTSADDMETSPISKRVRQLKNSEGGQNEMCKIMEDLCKEARQEGREEGRQEERLNILCEWVKEGGLTIHDAAKKSGLSEDAFRAAMRECYPDWHE